LRRCSSWSANVASASPFPARAGLSRPRDRRARMSDGFSMVRECPRVRPSGRYSSEGMMLSRPRQVAAFCLLSRLVHCPSLPRSALADKMWFRYRSPILILAASFACTGSSSMKARWGSYWRPTLRWPKKTAFPPRHCLQKANRINRLIRTNENNQNA
jgi:hypothetical protein